MDEVIETCSAIEELFDNLMDTNSRMEKELLVKEFKEEKPIMADDLDFCFEVLAGKHKIGFTFIQYDISFNPSSITNVHSIKDLVNKFKELDKTDLSITVATSMVPVSCREFIGNLVNRQYKLGFSNKDEMIKTYSPMLAKKYPEAISSYAKTYYIQEKLDGNRCIAYYDFDFRTWRFMSRSGKELKVYFDMKWANTFDIFDGEIMTLGHAGSRDFNKTSGAINGKFTNKNDLHYYIYDIVNEHLSYKERKWILDGYAGKTGDGCTILKVLDEITVYPNTDYNWKLDEWLDKITDQGGEGIMLRDPMARYQCGKRTDALIKYKKLKTMDLRITNWNLGTLGGKYEAAIGSFVCETDDHTIRVNVSGMPDDMHFSEPSQWIGKIVEVAYFDTSKSANNDYTSLRFPRLKRIRDDKDSTSIY